MSGHADTIRAALDRWPHHYSHAAALAALDALERERQQLREALLAVSNAYGCFAGCTGALPGGVGVHAVACDVARAALAAADETT